MVTTTSPTQTALPPPNHAVARADGTIDPDWFRWFKLLDAVARAINADLAGVPTKSQTEYISGIIKSPLDQDYRLVVKIPHGGTITGTTTRSTSGTCTATFKVNTTALGGTANSVSTSEQSSAHSSSNVFAADDDIVLTVSSNSSCQGMSFTIKYTKTLA
jgi:hypothetical protein